MDRFKLATERVLYANQLLLGLLSYKLMLGGITEIQGSLIKNENNLTIQMVLDRYSQKVRGRSGATGKTV